MLLSVFLIFMVTMVTGILVPGDEHLLTITEFKQKIVDKRWLGIYSFHNVPSVSVVSKALIKWTIDVGGGYVEQKQDVRLTYKALMGKVQEKNRTDWVPSSTPDNYHFHSSCRVQENEDGTCDKMFNTLLVPGDALEGHQGDLNLTGLPWGEIVQFMATVYGRSFEDNLLPPIKWIWRDKECPE